MDPPIFASPPLGLQVCAPLCLAFFFFCAGAEDPSQVPGLAQQALCCLSFSQSPQVLGGGGASYTVVLYAWAPGLTSELRAGISGLEVTGLILELQEEATDSEKEINRLSILPFPPSAGSILRRQREEDPEPPKR